MATDTDLVPREKSHWIRITILALVPVLIVAAAGVYLLTHHHRPGPPPAGSEAALSAYLDGVVKADYAGMAAHADVQRRPSRPSMLRCGAIWLVAASSYHAGLLTRDKTGDRGTAPYSARLTLTGLGALDLSRAR